MEQPTKDNMRQSLFVNRRRAAFDFKLFFYTKRIETEIV